MKWTVNNEHRPVCKYQMQQNSDPISFELFKSFSSCICFVIKITLVYVKFVFVRVHYAHKVCCVFSVQCLYSVFNFVVIKLCYCKIIMQEQKVVQVLPEPQCREEMRSLENAPTDWNLSQPIKAKRFVILSACHEMCLEKSNWIDGKMVALL